MKKIKIFVLFFLQMLLLAGVAGFLMDFAGIWPSEYISEGDSITKHIICGMLEFVFIAISAYIFAFKAKKTFEQIILFLAFFTISFYVFETVFINVIRVYF